MTGARPDPGGIPNAPAAGCDAAPFTVAVRDEVIGREGERSRTLAWDEVLTARPDVLVAACCGFSLERTPVDLPGLRARPG